jgi:leucyl aminopeptidase
LANLTKYLRYKIMQYAICSTKDFSKLSGVIVCGIIDSVLPTSLNTHIDLSNFKTFGESLYQDNIFLVNLGEAARYNLDKLKKAIKIIVDSAQQFSWQELSLAVPSIKTHDESWLLKQLVLSFENDLYKFDKFKSIKSSARHLAKINFVINASDADLACAKATAAGINMARDLANTPANFCTPYDLGNVADSLDAEFASVHTKRLYLKELEELKMGGLLAVARGSVHPPELIEVSYHGSDKGEAPIVLVGKGITFDAGGICLKPPAGMEEMKYDMAGAAAVLGVIKSCALLKLPITLIGLLPCAENLPSGSAFKPSDVITMMSGTTVEIVNTDAEGRLVLADALTYAKRFKPRYVIDIATLTGAVIVALGHVHSGLMTPSDELAKLLAAAMQQSADTIWRLPLDDAYNSALDNNFADMQNSGSDRTAGSITAACFLAKFTHDFVWAHLDIAGTAWVSGKKRSATGRPVALLLEFLRICANNAG